MQWLKSFFSEVSGKGSYGRLCGFLALILTLYIGLRATERAREVPENLESLAIFFLMVSGPYLGGKAAEVIKARKE